MASSLELLTQSDLTLLKSKATPTSFSAGTRIVRQGARVDHIYMIRSGRAVIERDGERIATMMSGDIFGEMSFLEQSSASAAVVADSEMVIDMISSDELNRTFEVFSQLAARFYRSLALTLSRRLRDTSRQLSRVSGQPIGSLDMLTSHPVETPKN